MEVIGIMQKQTKLREVFKEGPFYSFVFKVDKLSANAKVGMSIGTTNDELRKAPLHCIPIEVSVIAGFCLFQTKSIAYTDFSVWFCLARTEAVYCIGKNGQVLENMVYAIIGSDPNAQTICHLITENRPYGSFKVYGIERALIGMAEHYTCIGLGLKHKLTFFLRIEAARCKKNG